MKKTSYKAGDFIFHLFQDKDTINIGLASQRVYPVVNVEELKNLIDFITKFLEKTND